MSAEKGMIERLIELHVVKTLEKVREEVKNINDIEVVNGGVYARMFDVDEIIDRHIKEYTDETHSLRKGNL